MKNRGVCYQCKNGVFFSKIPNFYLTFFNVKKNSIFDWNSRVEEKQWLKKRTSFTKTTIYYR
jgi:hypothetical protein